MLDPKQRRGQLSRRFGNRLRCVQPTVTSILWCGATAGVYRNEQMFVLQGRKYKFGATPCPGKYEGMHARGDFPATSRQGPGVAGARNLDAVVAGFFAESKSVLTDTSRLPTARGASHIAHSHIVLLKYTSHCSGKPRQHTWDSAKLFGVQRLLPCFALLGDRNGALRRFCR